jgi:hypothetical protein
METQNNPTRVLLATWVLLALAAGAIIVATRLRFHADHKAARQPSAQQISSQGAQEPAGGLSVQELPS